MQIKVIKNIVWLSSEQVLRLAIGFFVGAWTARYLQPEQYGLLNYLLAFIGIFSPLANLNDLNQIAIRDIAIDPASKNEVLGNTFYLKISGALSALILSVGLIFVLKPDDHLSQIIILLISSSSGLFYAFSTIDYWFQYKVQSRYSVIAKNSAFITTNLIRIGLIVLHFPLIAFAWLIAFEYLLTSICLVAVYFISGENPRNWRPNFGKAKILIKNCWALLLSGVAISLYLRIDQMMLGQMVGNTEVGIYSIAVRMSDICSFLPGIITASMISATVEAKTRSDDEFYDRLQTLFDIMVLLAFSLAVAMSFASHQLIGIIYGKNYLESSTVVVVHVWSIVFVFLGIAKNIWIVTENKGYYALISTSSGAIINILLNLFLIPRYQSVGAAIATLISYAFADYVTCFIYPQARRIGWMMTRSITLISPISSVITGKFRIRK
jgi:polysaccharide transporter, PST family